MRIIKPGTMKEVWFVRHGESVENVDGIRRGEEGELTKLGKLQARAVAKRMKTLGIQALFSSPAKRALSTARIISKTIALPIIENDRLNEWRRSVATLGLHSDSPVVREIHKRSDAMSLIGMRQFADEDIFADALRDVKEMLMVFQEHPAKRLCVVTHNKKLRVMHGFVHSRGALTPYDFEDYYFTLDFDNGGISRFRYGTAWKDKIKPLWQIGCTNDTAHLEDVEVKD